MGSRWKRRAAWTVVLLTAVVPLATGQAFAVIGGRPASKSQINTAFAVFVNGTDGSFCSGSLIAAQWAVTAGHCLAGAATVRAGSLESDTGGQLVRVDRTVKAPADLGLLHLAQPVTASPIRIAGSSPSPGARATLMGWGQTRNGKAPGSRELKVLGVSVVKKGACAGDDLDPAHELCVGVTPTATACDGDSGGPLVVDGLLVGADSRGGNRCGDSGGEIYSDVTKSRSFIDGVIGRAQDAGNARDGKSEDLDGRFEDPDSRFEDGESRARDEHSTDENCADDQTNASACG